MNCERCGGLSVRERLDVRLWALRCIVCGWRFREPILDLHHAFSIPLKTASQGVMSFDSSKLHELQRYSRRTPPTSPNNGSSFELIS